jgi:hypothetical protein
MSEEQSQPSGAMSRFGQHRLLIMVGVVIVGAFFLTCISMALYEASGAAQLDLSRPGYKSVQSKANEFEKFDGFSATGPIDGSTLDDFKKQYAQQANEASGLDAFGGDVLNESVLRIDDPAQATPTDNNQ